MTDQSWPKLLLDIDNKVTTLIGGTYWQAFGPDNIQVDNEITQGVTIYSGGAVIPAGSITPGTYTVARIRGAVSSVIVGSTPSSKVDGSVYNSYNYPAVSWAIGDLSLTTFTGIVILVGGISTSLPPIQVYTRLVQEPDIDSKVTTINTVQGAMADAATASDLSDVTTTSTEAKLRRILLNQFNVALEVDLGNAQPDTLKSTNAKLGNPATTFAVQAAVIKANLTATISTGTFSLVNNILEQDCLIFGAATQQIDIELDMSNLTQVNAAREYVQTDGANSRQISNKAFPTAFDSGTKTVLFSFIQKGSAYKVTLQASVLEGGAKNVPYRYTVKPLS